jgi:hypothetical protein
MTPIFASILRPGHDADLRACFAAIFAPCFASIFAPASRPGAAIASIITSGAASGLPRARASDILPP